MNDGAQRDESVDAVLETDRRLLGTLTVPGLHLKIAPAAVVVLAVSEMAALVMMELE